MNNINDTNTNTKQQNIFNTQSIIDIFNESYTIYSINNIRRTIPSKIDGLKLVQRRILYSLYIRNFINKFNKSINTTGHVIGHFHPTGDASVYQALVKMTQKFSHINTLLTGQGNFGSNDGDPAAAPRYTEIALNNYSLECLEYLKYLTTFPRRKNFSETMEEPIFLPNKIPLLILNGCKSISTAMVSSIPPHNLTEICNAFIAIINRKLEQKPDLDTKEILKIIKGPDFINGNIINSTKLFELYNTGKSTIDVYADIELDKDQSTIIIKSVPYNVTKKKVREDLIDMVYNKKIIQVKKITDLSEGDEVKIKIVLPKPVDINKFKIIKNRLFKYASLKKIIPFNFLALDDQERPVRFNLKQYLYDFLELRKKIEINAISENVQSYLKIISQIEALKIVHQNTKEILKIIKNDPKELVYKKLEKEYKLTKEQTTYILTITLNRLRPNAYKPEKEKLKLLNNKLKESQFILNNEFKLLEVLKKYFITIKKKFGKTRKTKIQNIQINKLDYIYEENLMIYLTDQNYIFKKPSKDFSIQKKGSGKKTLIKGLGNKYGKIKFIQNCNNKDSIILCSDKGKCISQKIYLLFKNDTFINSEIFFQSNPSCINVINEKHKYIIFITKLGYISKIKKNFTDSHRIRRLITIRNNDELRFVLPCTLDDKYIILTTKDGKMLFLDIETFAIRQKRSKGKKSIKFTSNDQHEIISVSICKKKDISDQTFVIIYESGNSKLIKMNKLLTAKMISSAKNTNRSGTNLISKNNKKHKLAYIFILDFKEINKYELYITTNELKTSRRKLNDISSRKTKFSLGKTILNNKNTKIKKAIIIKRM